MACPYCRSRKVREEYTVQTYDLKEDWIAINHVQCGKCGAYYSKTIRENPRTGKRKVFCTKGSYLTGNPPQQSFNRSRPIRDRILSMFRRR